MYTAKIIRHRHRREHYINDDIKSVKEEVHFKIVFSHPAEMQTFQRWCKKHRGFYDFDRNHSYNTGKMPRLNFFTEKICWCDVMSFYLLHVAGYDYHSSIHPYKGEVYIRQG